MRLPSRIDLALGAAGALGLALSLQTYAVAQPANNYTANSADQHFVTDAINGGNQEIEQARAELKATSNPSVKLFAQTMIHDHTAANSQIAAVARSLGLTVPNSPSSSTPLSGSMPAGTYMQSEVADHQKTIALFKAEETNGSRQLATTAGQILPILNNHLAMAQEFVSSGTVTPKTTPTPPARTH